MRLAESKTSPRQAEQDAESGHERDSARLQVGAVPLGLLPYHAFEGRVVAYLGRYG